MKKLFLGAAAVLSVWGGAGCWVASRGSSAAAARAKQHAAVVALGDKVAEAVKAIDPSGPSLKEACAGKLTPGPMRSIVGYVLELPADQRPEFRQAVRTAVGQLFKLPGEKIDNVERLDGLLLGVEDSGRWIERIPTDRLRPHETDLMEVVIDFTEWGRRLDDAVTAQATTASLRYVAVTALSELVPPTVAVDANGESKGFTSGTSRYRTRVLAYPSGELVCEGAGNGRFEQTEVVGRGSTQEAARYKSEQALADGWVKATSASALDDLCATGGDVLCNSTHREVEAPW